MVQIAVASGLGEQPAVRARRSLRLNPTGVGALLGVWICLYPFADLFLRPRRGFLGASQADPNIHSPVLLGTYVAIVLIGIIPILAGALSLGVDFRRAKLLAVAIVPICLSIPLSLLSASDLGCMQYVLSIDYVFLCALVLVATNLDGQAFIRGFFTAAPLTLSLAMVAALADHDFAWGRFFGHMAPNYWGGLGLTAILASIAMRGWVLRTLVILISLGLIYVSQSRGEMLALVMAFGLAAILFMRHPRAGRWSWVWFVVAIGLVAVVGLGSSFIADKLLLLSSTDRGLNSGLSGRVDGWREAEALFASHPWLGVGFQQYGRYMSTPTLVIHNAYLTALADTGVVGLLAYVIFIFGALIRAFVAAWNRPDRANVAVVALLFADALVGLVEPTGLHTGDTLAMLTIFMTAWAWRAELKPMPIEAGPAWIPPASSPRGEPRPQAEGPGASLPT